MYLVDLTWLFFGLSLIGAFFNARQNVIGFYPWIVANIGWSIYDYCVGSYAQMALFIIYTGISTYGIIQWRMVRKKNSNKEPIVRQT